MRHRPAFETVGGYAIYEEFAAGGMATVHFGRRLDPGGQAVAVKRMYPHFTRDPDFLTMFTDEARLAALVRHPNVVPVLDVVSEGAELSLVMSFVIGESFGKLLRAARDARRRAPPRIVAAVIIDALRGLHAAHEAVGEHGEPLGIVHRDVSPQNVLVGADGIGRVLDFGVAKARGRLQTTREGQLKGKISYMAPEQLDGGVVDRRADIFPAGSILWEALVGRRLFDGASEAAIIRQLLDPEVSPPSRYARELIHFDEVIARALTADPARRYPTAAAMAADIEERVTPAPYSEVAAWARDLAGKAIDRRARRAAEIEAAPTAELAALPERPRTPPSSGGRGERDGDGDGATEEMVLPPDLDEGSRTLEMSQIYFEATRGPHASPLPVPPSPPPPAHAQQPQQLQQHAMQSSDRWSWPQSQVSSVSLTTPMPAPPPLPPARVRMLATAAVVAAIASAIVSSLILSLVPRGSEGEPVLEATAGMRPFGEIASQAAVMLDDAGPTVAPTEAADAALAADDAPAAASAAPTPGPAAITPPKPRPQKVSPQALAPAGPVKLPAPRPAPAPSKR